MARDKDENASIEGDCRIIWESKELKKLPIGHFPLACVNPNIFFFWKTNNLWTDAGDRKVFNWQLLLSLSADGVGWVGRRIVSSMAGDTTLSKRGLWYLYQRTYNQR